MSSVQVHSIANCVNRTKLTSLNEALMEERNRMTVRRPFLRRLPQNCRCHCSWMSVVIARWPTPPPPPLTSSFAVLRRSAWSETVVGWTEWYGYGRSQVRPPCRRNSSHDVVPAGWIADCRFSAPVPSPDSSTGDAFHCTWRHNNLTSLSSVNSSHRIVSSLNDVHSSQIFCQHQFLTLRYHWEITRRFILFIIYLRIKLHPNLSLYKCTRCLKPFPFSILTNI